MLKFRRGFISLVSEENNMPKIENLQDLRKIKESAAKQMVARQTDAPQSTTRKKAAKKVK